MLKQVLQRSEVYFYKNVYIYNLVWSRSKTFTYLYWYL